MCHLGALGVLGCNEIDPLLIFPGLAESLAKTLLAELHLLVVQV